MKSFLSDKGVRVNDIKRSVEAFFKVTLDEFSGISDHLQQLSREGVIWLPSYQGRIVLQMLSGPVLSAIHGGKHTDLVEICQTHTGGLVLLKDSRLPGIDSLFFAKGFYDSAEVKEYVDNLETMTFFVTDHDGFKVIVTPMKAHRKIP
jgi:hypothetical protein